MPLIESKDKSKADNKAVGSENTVANNQRVGYIELSLCVGLLSLFVVLVSLISQKVCNHSSMDR
jgi:hypothetical protein